MTGGRTGHITAGRLKALVTVLLVLLITAGCFMRSSGPSDSERRAPCDRLAAQAIDADDLGEARRLSARASECYSGLQSRD